MRGTGAARRREQDQEPPPAGAATEADLRRIITATDGVVAGLRRHDRAIASVVGKMQKLAAEYPDAGHLAALADKLGVRQSQVIVELISLAEHSFENREAFELYVQTAAFTETMRAAAFEAGRQAGIAEEQARQPRASRGRHAARSRHLKVAGSIAAGSAVAASLVAPAVIAARDSAAVRYWSPRPASVRLHAGPADSAVLMPSSQPRAYVPRHAKPAADAASASPAPSPSLPAPSPSPSVPSSQPPAAPSGTLDVQTAMCVIGADGTCKITFEAVGGAAYWHASVSDPALSLGSNDEGILRDRQPGVITVTVRAGALAGTGTVTLVDGHGNATRVQVTWVAVPGLPL